MSKIGRFICLAFLTLVIVVSLSGCNTVRGAGEDIEDAGQSIERASGK